MAIVMDGNGRWAQSRGHARTVGHRAGGEAVRRTVEAALDLGVATLTLYAFSADNWKRPRSETDALMTLFGAYLRNETTRCVESGVRLKVVGRRDRLSPPLVAAIATAEEATKAGHALRLRLAIDYSARDSLLQAACQFRGNLSDRAAFARAVEAALHDDAGTPDVDLLIRTGGEQRFSDLFGWDCAYAEVLFTQTMWPDFMAAELKHAIEEFDRRDRRFGALSGAQDDRGPASQRNQVQTESSGNISSNNRRVNL